MSALLERESARASARAHFVLDSVNLRLPTCCRTPVSCLKHRRSEEFHCPARFTFCVGFLNLVLYRFKIPAATSDASIRVCFHAPCLTTRHHRAPMRYRRRCFLSDHRCPALQLVIFALSAYWWLCKMHLRHCKLHDSNSRRLSLCAYPHEPPPPASFPSCRVPITTLESPNT